MLHTPKFIYGSDRYWEGENDYRQVTANQDRNREVIVKRWVESIECTSEESVNFTEWNGKELLPGKELKGLRGGDRGKSTLISSSKVRFLQPKAEEL